MLCYPAFQVNSAPRVGALTYDAATGGETNRVSHHTTMDSSGNITTKLGKKSTKLCVILSTVRDSIIIV